MPINSIGESFSTKKGKREKTPLVFVCLSQKRKEKKLRLFFFGLDKI